MRTHFDEQLSELNVQLITMGSLCEEAIRTVADCLITEKSQDLHKVAEINSEIEEMQKDIEGRCMRLLLQQQPVAKDLRSITAALRIIYDMARIGNQAGDIAEMVEYVLHTPLQGQTSIAEMSNATVKMVQSSIDAFVRKDQELAVKVIHYDDVVDTLFHKMKDEMTESIQEQSSDAEACVDLVMIAKYFERIGDHGENIAEWVYYSVTGQYWGVEGERC